MLGVSEKVREESTSARHCEEKMRLPYSTGGHSIVVLFTMLFVPGGSEAASPVGPASAAIESSTPWDEGRNAFVWTSLLLEYKGLPERRLIAISSIADGAKATPTLLPRPMELFHRPFTTHRSVGFSLNRGPLSASMPRPDSTFRSASTRARRLVMIGGGIGLMAIGAFLGTEPGWISERGRCNTGPKPANYVGENCIPLKRFLLGLGIGSVGAAFVLAAF